MAVNQTQVDDIIHAALVQDPAVRLQDLEREVGILKTSIKHILMDIRERMNELENPFTISSPCTNTGIIRENPDTISRESALNARKAALDARESLLESEKEPSVSELPTEKNISPSDTGRVSGTQKYPVSDTPAGITAHHPSTQSLEPLPLQKAYNLFIWTQHGVKKFGHARLEILAESYSLMGYIQKDTANEIRQISQLMPLNMGEKLEIGPDEFVYEIYSLNRILTPHDTSLDRDMIEVMMNQRKLESRAPNGLRRSDTRPESARKPESKDVPGFGNADVELINLRV